MEGAGEVHAREVFGCMSPKILSIYFPISGSRQMFLSSSILCLILPCQMNYISFLETMLTATIVPLEIR